MITRRSLLTAASTGATLIGLDRFLPIDENSAQAAGFELSPVLPAGTRAEALLDELPGKMPLIKLAYRPPNYETPLEYFRDAITPNEAFFVRYHLSNIPKVDEATWKLKISGEGAEQELEINLEDLKKMPSTEVVAINQCSGNRRGLFEPHVPGVQWGYGAMGCARWKGVRLKDVLDKVKVKKEAVEVVFDGADGPPLDKTPDFIKSIPVWKANEETTLIAYEMNGEPLPHFNGFPVRVIVPGWTGTYWVKHLISIKVVTKPDANFWMAQAYRVPLGKFPVVSRFTSQETATNTPITEIMINSLITSHVDGAHARMGVKTTVKGLAWDGGYGIRTVEASMDEGRTWTPTSLGDELGRFAFRPFSYSFVPKTRGKLAFIVRATNKIGQTQTTELIQNPAGYYHNLMHRISFNVI
jgi:DMSO/TMAO reductase YedYZ molybdopterin-dependent catalytic subunit